MVTCSKKDPALLLSMPQLYSSTPSFIHQEVASTKSYKLRDFVMLSHSLASSSNPSPRQHQGYTLFTRASAAPTSLDIAAVGILEPHQYNLLK